MGMAASQARYLQITARKINTEYAGQQVNQQRTMLANESAGLFAQLMALQVPTAPNVSDFTTIQYTFNDGVHDCTITNIDNITGDPDFNANVSYYYTESTYTGIQQTRNDLGVRNVAGTYWLTNGIDNRTQMENIPDEATDPVTYQKDYGAVLQFCKDNPTSQIAADAGYDPVAGTIDPADLVANIYKYTNAGATYYMAGTDLAAAAALIPSGRTTTLNMGYSAYIDKTFPQETLAYLQTTQSGRYEEITLDNYTQSFDLNASTVTDELAYDDAMNEYNYQQQVYDKAISDINAKTEILEQEDRTLELKLARLDTEQQALQTELDAVKKVIDKNIEETFKTFAS